MGRLRRDRIADAVLGIQPECRRGLEASAKGYQQISGNVALREANLRVPEDVAVIGYDDVPLASQTEPPLSTVRQAIQKLQEAKPPTLSQYRDELRYIGRAPEWANATIEVDVFFVACE